MCIVNDVTSKLTWFSLGFHAFSAHRAQKETKLDQLKLREEEIRQADEEAQKFVKEELKQLYSMAQEIGMSARESGAIVDDLVEEWTIQRTGDGPVIEEGEYQTLWCAKRSCEEYTGHNFSIYPWAAP